ncbi:MAG: hypothetical protein RSD95_07430 [Clostridia bacterium]
MILRFPHAFAVSDRLKKAVKDAVNQFQYPGMDGIVEFEGDTVAFDVIKNGFYLKDNLDLYIDDAIPGNMVGFMMKLLRARNFLQENARVIPENRIGLHLVPPPEPDEE